MPKYLTDRTINALKRKPAPPGKRYEIMDTTIPGFGVRVNDTGDASFFLVTRYPGQTSPGRRSIGRVGVITLATARETAGQWKGLVARGIDPQEQAQRERHANQLRRANSVSAVFEDFVSEKLARERKGKEVERDIRRDVLPDLGGTPITDVSEEHIAAIIKAKVRKAPTQARNLLGVLKRFFQWAVDQRAYGLKISPAATLKPLALCGEKVRRSRVLTDAEIFALWRAVERTPYPHGPVYRLLILKALRLNEAADAAWPEFDLAQKLWIIPADRMKARNSQARPHAVPLSDADIAMLETLPRFEKGGYLFSTTFGASPVWMSDKIKKRIDQRMLRTLKALARRQGVSPKKVTLPPWTNHDVRRSVRSNLSRLKVTEEAREAVLAHVRPGIKATYDVYDYATEKAEALDLWASRLKVIVSAPAEGNVVLWTGRQVAAG